MNSDEIESNQILTESSQEITTLNNNTIADWVSNPYLKAATSDNTRKAYRSDIIDYRHILEKENELFALYYPKGRNKENSLIEAEVIAYFYFEKQILKIHGQVRLIKGDYTEADMKNS